MYLISVRYDTLAAGFKLIHFKATFALSTFSATLPAVVACLTLLDIET